MNTLRFALLISALALASNAFAAPSITTTSYGITKEVSYTQDSSSDPALTANPYRLTAFLNSDSSSPMYSFTPPGQSTQSFGSGGYSSTRYSNLTDFNTAYPNGTYTMSDGQHTPSLNPLLGDAYPAVGKILGGSWSGGALLVNATQNYTLNFSGIPFPTADDSVGLVFENSISHATQSYFPASNASSFLITGGTLVDGETYNVTVRLNHNFINYGVALMGTTGSASYTTLNTFQITAIPEPSTYAAILGASALVGVMIQRRRRALAA